MRTLRLVVLASLVAVSACSSGTGLTEYAGEVEALVATMNARIDQLDAEVEQKQQSLQGVRSYAQERVEARSGFLAGLRALEPPDEAADLHDVALGIMERLTVAEAALADRVMTMESMDGIDSIWSTPEGIAALTADEKAIELCLAAQSEFDDTAGRSEFRDVPWIPSEMKEVVVVAFGCIADNR
jgi:outer membrane murein-binding lipoprotein Lpp